MRETIPFPPILFGAKTARIVATALQNWIESAIENPNWNGNDIWIIQDVIDQIKQTEKEWMLELGFISDPNHPELWQRKEPKE